MGQLLGLTPFRARDSRKSPVSSTREPFKEGLSYVGPVGDYDWNYYHDQGRKYLEATALKVQTSYVKSVSEGANAEPGSYNWRCLFIR